ncbi:ABC transporter permease [Pseudofrankia sp. DC12]|uniref:ABC transporter permease n=1 Tax=Pseudofrankia sp. DC12 TaxID=683315 RepID=UPI000A04FF87|nr:ABC transporter permease [Pseudofrankia sp. DC12]
MNGPSLAQLLRAAAAALVAPLLALVTALTVTVLVLVGTGGHPLDVLDTMVTYAQRPRSQTLMVNSAVTYYFSAVAVAIGFRMNLFNIGVDGQYRLAALLAAAAAAQISLPHVLHVAVVLLIAMGVGALWAGVAALLKVYRGVSEVISTIMLNFIATALIAYLLTPGRLAVRTVGSNNIGTPTIPGSGQVPGLALIPDSRLKVYGLAILAVAIGAGYWFLLSRTRFGFDLRAAGASEDAARSSGVRVSRMIIVSMLLSGAVAGLVGMPQLLGDAHTFSLDFPAGLGFTGIAIALLGRNHPVGIAIGALLFGFLDNAATSLELNGVSRDIVLVTQGVIVLSVVVAYELVRRLRTRAEQRDVGRRLGTLPSPSGGPGAPPSGGPGAPGSPGAPPTTPLPPVPPTPHEVGA